MVTWRAGQDSCTGSGGHGRPREATGGHRLVTWRTGDLTVGQAKREATGGHGRHGRPFWRPQVGNLEALDSIHWDRVREAREATGGHGRPWEATGGNLEG